MSSLRLDDVTLPEPSALPGYFADPDLVVIGDRYFLYPTTDGQDGWTSRSFRAFSSPDLVDWVDHGVILDLPSEVSWADAHAWAPAVAHRDGRYFLYYTAAEGNIGVAVSDTPVGPFVDRGRPLIADGDFSGRAIDPSVFTDHSGAAYLFWGNGVAHGVPLASDMLSFDPADVRSWQPPRFREAAMVHERAGVFYLSWSVDDTRSEDYRVEYATGPGPLGPWTARGVLLSKDPARRILATGHHSITRLPGTDDWVIAYHRFAIPAGDGFHREITFDRLVHRDDGLIEPVAPSGERLHLPLHNTES